MIGLLEPLISNTVVIMPIAVLARLCSRWGARPAWVHSLWLLVLLKLVTPPIFRVPVTISWESPTRVISECCTSDAVSIDRFVESPAWQPPPASPGSSGEALDVAAVGTPETPRRPWRPSPMLSASWLWLLGAGTVALLSLRQLLSFSRRAAGLTRAPGSLIREVEELARKVRLRRTPEIYLTREVISPMVWAPAFRPRLILPETLLERLSADERQTLILHELAHVRRRDHWVRYLELAVRVLHWCNPLAWWAIHELRAAEEECCDVWVTSVFRNSERQYSAALLAAAEFLSSPTRRLPATTPGVGGIPELRRRLKMIFRPHAHRSLNFAGKLAIVLAASLMIPLLPGWGQEAKPDQNSFTDDQPAAGAGDGFLDLYLANAHDPRAEDSPSPAEVARAFDLAVQLLIENGHHAEARIIVETARRTAETPSPNPFHRKFYVVQPGDTLRKIALRELGTADAWPEIAATNGITDSDRLAVGSPLYMPGRADARQPDGADRWRVPALRPTARGETYPEPEGRPTNYALSSRRAEFPAPASGERLDALEQKVQDLTELLHRVLLQLDPKKAHGSGDR